MAALDDAFKTQKAFDLHAGKLMQSFVEISRANFFLKSAKRWLPVSQSLKPLGFAILSGIQSSDIEKRHSRLKAMGN